MSEDRNTPATDLIRWTFSVNPEHRAAIEGHLNDLGLDVLVRDEGQFVVTWEEPEGETDEVIEAIWAINGEPFEVTQEEFQRLGLHTLHHAEECLMTNDKEERL
jgi:hypothetical protein